MCAYRGNDIAMVFQDPLSSLTPVYTVGTQIIEALTIHNPGMSNQAKEARAVELLAMVGIPSPKNRLKAFPHEFSGGMRQRVMIAIAIANNPRVLIADEPTTALDVTIQAQVLEVLHTAQEETGAAVVMITHDLGVVAGIADDIMVMYAGKPVETGQVDDIYYNPRMPYTMGLLGAVPRVDVAEKTSLVPIDGIPPNLIYTPTGCSFAPRCPLVTDACLAGEPQLLPAGEHDGHKAACIKSASLGGDVDVLEIFSAPPVPVSGFDAIPRAERATVLELKDVRKHFPLTKGALLKRRIGTVKAVDGLSFDIREGECFSIVGESGSGKTTTLLEIMEFHKDQDGEVVIGGLSNKKATDARTKSAMRRELQMVFQDPTGALDPRFTVYEVLAEPLQNAGMDKAAITEADHGTDEAGGAAARPRQPVPQPVLRRPAAARGHRPCPGREPETRGPGRARVRAGRLRPGRRHQPAGQAARRAGPQLPDGGPRPLGGPAHLQPGGRDVPRARSWRSARWTGSSTTPATPTRGPCSPPSLCRTRSWNGPGSGSSSRATSPRRWMRPRAATSPPAALSSRRFPRRSRRSASRSNRRSKPFRPSAAAEALEAGPVPVPDQQFACFFPDGELDEDMLVVHETAEPHAP